MNGSAVPDDTDQAAVIDRNKSCDTGKKPSRGLVMDGEGMSQKDMPRNAVELRVFPLNRGAPKAKLSAKWWCLTLVFSTQAGARDRVMLMVDVWHGRVQRRRCERTSEGGVVVVMLAKDRAGQGGGVTTQQDNLDL